MSSIVENQRRAYLAHANDTATQLAGRLLMLSPAQRAAIIASVAYHSQTPIDITLVTDERDDPSSIAMLLDGDVPSSEVSTWAWALGSGCIFQVVKP